MSSSQLPNIPSFRKQQLYLYFESLKAHCPEGIYLTVTPGDPAIWPGILFVQSGPYSSAVLRFQISFPNLFPELPPLITFSTEIFHPLVVPLTTYTFSTSAADASATVGATDEERLPSGAFSFRNEFPSWFGRSRQEKENRTVARRMGDNNEIDDGIGSQTNKRDQPLFENPSFSRDLQRFPISKLLAYVKAAFEDSALLDSLPLSMAANPGAWHAWRSHRGLPKATSRAATPTNEDAERDEVIHKHPGDWNWEGVWEKRVKLGIEESISDSVLFGGARGGAPSNEVIRFQKLDEEQLAETWESILRQQSEEILP